MSPARLSESEWERLAKGFQVGQLAESAKPKRSKYRACRVVVTLAGLIYAKAVAKEQGIKGIEFDSRREATHYLTLLGMQSRGLITDLELQPRFEIHADGGRRVAAYVADFRYVDVKSGRVHVIDVKGVRTQTYRLKKKLVEAEHGIAIEEV